jgi:hypothetical protein
MTGYIIRVSARPLGSCEEELYRAAIDHENLAKLTVRAFSSFLKVRSLSLGASLGRKGRLIEPPVSARRSAVPAAVDIEVG